VMRLICGDMTALTSVSVPALTVIANRTADDLARSRPARLSPVDVPHLTTPRESASSVDEVSAVYSRFGARG
jgi:hypothetical protein